jgi:DsbC/DsbD-like thiol-disulfide interchange protein
VTLEARLSTARVSAGGSLEARVALTIADGYSVNPRSPGKDLQALSVSVPGEDFVASAPRYPEPSQVQRGLELVPAYAGTVSVTVPLRVRAGRTPGEARVRLRVGFQTCDRNECRAPDSAVLDVPVTVVAASNRK